MMQIGMIATIVLLVANLSLSIYSLLLWRNINPYAVIPTIFIMLVFILWIVAYIYNEKLGMYRNRRLVESVIYNDYAINVITPWEWIQYNYTYVPIMKALEKILSSNQEKEDLLKARKVIEGMLKRGYVLPEQVPKRVRKFFKTFKAIWEM